MLNNNDIDVLLKALDAYKSQASSSGLMSVMISAMLTKKEDKGEWEREANETMEKAKREGESLEETVILLKAKLIQMRDRATVAEASAFLKAG